MLNRKQKPTLNSIETIHFVEPRIFDITENVKLYFMQEVPNETCRIDLYFDAGNIRHNKGTPTFVNALLLSGTTEKTATQISNEIDALGGFIDSGLSAESSVFTLYCLRENALKIIDIIVNSINGLTFNEKEINELINDKKQVYLTNIEKVSFLAQREFQKKLFHGSSSYSKVVDESFYKDVTQKDLKHFFTENYLNGLSKVVVVGNLSQDDVDDLIDTVGKWAKEGDSNYESSIQNLPGSQHIEKDGAVQTAIRVGRTLFNKCHEDYNDFIVLNTIIGDYFGSRLMANIREDKGYTYGIGSMVAEYKEFGYFLIATEVGKDVKDATLKEIQYEIKRLQEELVGEEELELVRSYLLGQLLKSADGPYSMTDLYLSAEAQGLDSTFYNQVIHDLNKITPLRIQELAKKYLNWDDMTVVTAG
ncbi:MAG: M16 family metallopeptidase [Crocinitomicaceae bacterium]